VDVDRDGDLDLVLAGTQLAVYWQTRPREFDPEPTQVGEGTTFGGGPRFVRATDVDGDGQIDLACGYSDGTGTRFAVYWREGAREFDPKPTILLSDPAQHVSIELQAADIDGDGKVDFALGISSSPTLRISWQSAPREFELTSVGNVPTPSGPVSMRIADVEADGDLDIVTNTSALFWQVGPRDFRQSIVAVSGYMQVADVDNDGDLDLAASSGHVLWQSGPGQFDSSPVQVGIGITQFSDVDSDDDLDIVSATQGQGSAQIQWQSQPGVFDPDPLVVGEAPVLGNAAVLQGASDVDGDGRADLVMTGGIDSRIKILWQSNARNIEAEADLLGDSNSLESPYLLRSADLDGDGDLDLASACLADDSLRIWWQERPGRFALQPTVMPLAEIASLCPADIDGDGRIDLAVTIGSSGMLIYWQGALGQFDVAPTNLSNSQFLSYPISLTAEDVDGDGDLDLAFANNNNGGSGKLGVYWQTGTRTFSATPTLVPPNFNQAIADVQDLTVVDIDLDGDRDLVSANQFSLAIFRQTNPGVFQSNPILIQGNFPGTNRPVAVEAADIDGDGDVDLASANHGENGTGTLTLFRRTGTTTFEPVPLLLGNLLPVEFGFEPNDLRIVDVDRDGDPDLACTSSKTDYPVRVYWQLSPWRFDPISSHLGDPITVDQSYALEVADIDGDGDLDLASANIHSETISIFWGGR
jgi:hypothetical protein